MLWLANGITEKFSGDVTSQSANQIFLFFDQQNITTKSTEYGQGGITEKVCF